MAYIKPTRQLKAHVSCASRYARYDWQGLSELRSLGAKARRSLSQLLPYSWERFHWAAFRSPRRLLECGFIVALMMAFDLNTFFLKHALWLPPTDPLNTIRLVIWFLCCLPGVREWYEYIEDAPGPGTPPGTSGADDSSPMFRKLGAFAWLAIAMTCVETLVSYKVGKGMYGAPWPPAVLHAWGAAGSATALGIAAWQAQRMRVARRRAS